VYHIPQNVFILGDGGLAREVGLILEQMPKKWQFAGYVGPKSEDAFLEMVSNEGILSVIIGIGIPRIRRIVYDRFIVNGGLNFINLIHPSATFGYDAHLGIGNVFTAGVQATTGLRIGDNNYFNLNVTVGHDAQIGDHCVINPGVHISGHVILEGENLLGAGSQVLAGLTIGRGAIVGAGAVVTKNVDAGSVVVGIPAKLMERE